jgi:AraC-like DNA-binding protein/mannose-6-phosphate isomerase-like protein (cupin superfamily)
MDILLTGARQAGTTGSAGSSRRAPPADAIREGFPGQRLTVIPASVVRQAMRLPIVRELYVTDIGHFPVAPGHFVRRSRGSRETILIYCTRGQGWCELGGREWQIRDGWALMIPPGTPHGYGAHGEEPWGIWWAHFGGSQAAAFREVLGVSVEQPVLYAPHVSHVGGAFEEAYGHLDGGYSENTLLGLSTCLTRILGLLKLHQRSPSARRRDGETRVHRSIAYMRDNLDQPLRLADLATVAEMSPTHFSGVFRKLTGTPPCHFFTQLKVRRACELLDSTPRSISSVARDVGFADQFHFSRVFKQIVGRSPMRYREAVKG